MPTLEIEGREVEVDDSFLKLSPADQQATVEEIASQLGIKSNSSAPAPVSGMLDQFWSGMDQPLEDIGVSMEEAGKAIGSDNLQGAGQSMRGFTSKPDNFVSASDRFMNPKEGDSYVDPVLGFGWGNFGGAVAEQAGGYAGSIAARSAGGLAGSVAGPKGAVAGALAGPALFEFIRQVGPIAKQRAENDGRTEPDWSDWAWAAGTAGASGALETVGLGRIGLLNEGLKELGQKTATGVVKEAVKETGKKALKEGATEAGQSVVEQYGSTTGTATGSRIDLKQAIGEGIIGAGAGGMVDAGRNIRPTTRTALDVRSIDSAMRNDSDAQVQAEITRDVNDIAARMSGSGKAPLSQEVNRYTSDLKRQIKKAIDGQNLDPEDKNALKGGMQDATGLTQDRLDEIAGRSENPSEIQALARKIQVIREMTMQKQTAKGFRGALAGLAYHGGAALGGAIGSATGTPQGAAAGSYIGDRIGTGIARRLRGSQTQGVAIDNLIGKKQARRAQMLLDRFGPSEATTALNTLTERAAANKAQQEADAQAKADFEETMSRIRFRNKMRNDSLKAEENAKTREEKARLQAERNRLDLETRQTRLQNITYQAMGRKARAEQILQKLEAEKSINALHIEMAQARKDLQKHMAEQKAAESKDKADGRALDLQGKIVKLAKDIEIRNEALKRAKLSTARAEKIAARVPEAVPKAEAMARKAKQKYDRMTAAQMDKVEVDQYGNPIANSAQYRMKAEDIMKLQADGLVDALKFEDKAIGNIFIEAIGDFKNAPGHKNQAIRMAIYERVKQAVPLNNLDAQRFIAMYIRPLAFAFEAAAGDPNSFGASSRLREGREDFGTTEDLGEDPPF